MLDCLDAVSSVSVFLMDTGVLTRIGFSWIATEVYLHTLPVLAIMHNRVIVVESLFSNPTKKL